jgi:hypothetical protein
VSNSHEHDHICGPECNHGHHHEHECGPECGHDHGHNHEGLYADLKEQPTVYSFSKSIELNERITGKELAAVLSCWIEELQGWAHENKYLIGHIKTFTEIREGNLWLASTGRGVNTKASEGWDSAVIKSFVLNLAEIIFGPDKTALEEKTMEILSSKLPSHKKT